MSLNDVAINLLMTCSRVARYVVGQEKGCILGKSYET